MFAENKTEPKRFRSLRNSLIFAFLILGALFLSSSTIILLYSNYQIQQKVIFNQQQLAAQNAAYIVSDFIQEKFRILDQASDLNSLPTKPEGRKLILEKLLGRNPEFRQLMLLDDRGSVLSNVSSDLIQKSETLDQFKEILLGEALGGKQYVSPVYFDSVTSEPLVLVAIPTKNSFRERIGVFVAEINLKFIWDLVGNIKVGKEGFAFLVDRSGNLIAFRDISRVLIRENLGDLHEVNQFISGDLENTNGRLDISKGIQGNKVTSTFAPLGIPDWAVVVELPVVEAYQPTIQQAIYSLIVVLFNSIIGMLGAFYVAKRITNPIISLRDAALEISQGKLDTKIEQPQVNNEISQLSLAFNSMAAKLKKSYFGLEKQVQDKTGELSFKLNELERTNKLMIDRELKMIELKEEIKKLKNGGQT